MFVRNIYDKDIETRHFEPLLAEIERVRSGLADIPTQTNLNFIKSSAMQGWLEENAHGKIVGTLIFEIFNRLQFFCFSNVYKTINLIDALELMYNAKNYIGWVLVGRAIIEQCAIFNYYTKKFLDTNPCRTDFALSELKTIEDLMIQYSHGTRCNWHALIAGDLINFNKNPNEDAAGTRAVNIITALQHLQKRKGPFDGIEGMYAIFSDFAHPNMASHGTVVNVNPPEHEHSEIDHVEIALHVNRPRGEFIVFATLTAVCLCVQTIIELYTALSPALGHWNDELMQGKVHVHSDG